RRGGGPPGPRNVSGSHWRGAYGTPPARWRARREMPSHDQRADDQEIERVGDDASCECGFIIAEVIVKHAREPAADRHAAAAEKEQCGNAPACFAQRE